MKIKIVVDEMVFPIENPDRISSILKLVLEEKSKKEEKRKKKKISMKLLNEAFGVEKKKRKKRGKRNKWTSTDDYSLGNMLSNNQPISKIARVLGRTRTTVYQRIKLLKEKNLLV